MTRAALYAGSFDPVTNGHVEIVKAACRLFDRLVVGVGVHHAKTPLLGADERVGLLHEVCGGIAAGTACRVEIVTFTGLLTDAARLHGVDVLVRGLRSGTDFDYEMEMAGMNAVLHPGTQTVFLPAPAPVRSITASLVRQIATMGGDVSHFVPAPVAAALARRFAAPTQE